MLEVPDFWFHQNVEKELPRKKCNINLPTMSVFCDDFDWPVSLALFKNVVSKNSHWFLNLDYIQKQIHPALG